MPGSSPGYSFLVQLPANVSEKQQMIDMIDQVLGFLSPLREIKVEFLALPGPVLGSEIKHERSLSLFLSHFFTISFK